MYLSITCEGCKEPSEDLSILLCGFYCKICIEKLLQQVDINTNEFECFFCKETHKVPSKGFKILHATGDDDNISEKLCKDYIYRGNLVEQLKDNLKEIKVNTDKMAFNLNNPIDFIKEHCVKQRNQVDLRVEELIKQINDYRDEFLNEINVFERESFESLDINQDYSKTVQDFLTETNEFCQKWDSYLTNSKITDEEVKNANEIAKYFQNKITISKRNIMSLIFNKNILYFKKDKDDLPNFKFGCIDRSKIGQINFDGIKTKNLQEITTLTVVRSFYDDKILMNYSSNNREILEVRNGDMNSIVIKDFGSMEFLENFLFCELREFIIVYYQHYSDKYLVKFDKDLLELKKTKLDYKIFSLKSSENFIYALKKHSSDNEICVFNDELNMLYRLGQSRSPESPFYITNEIRGFFIIRKKFFFIYMDKGNIVDEETGNIITIFDIKCRMMRIDPDDNLYSMNIERSMIVMYDSNGHQLDQIQLINTPEKINFFIDKQRNARFFLNENKITDAFKIFPDYF